MIKTAVVSSNISMVGWANETMYVKFKHGKVYAYDGVPLTTFNVVVEADSVGKAFNSFVRESFPMLGPLDTDPFELAST